MDIIKFIKDNEVIPGKFNEAEDSLFILLKKNKLAYNLYYPYPVKDIITGTEFYAGVSVRRYSVVEDGILKEFTDECRFRPFK